MARPERLKSSLAGASPITPPAQAPQQAPEPQASAPAPAPQAQPAVADEVNVSASRARTSTATRKVTNKGRIGPYLTPEDANRVRAAWDKGWREENVGSFSDFLEQAIFKEVERLEKKYNNGEPWPGLEAGAIKSLSQMNVEARRRAAK